MQENGIGVPATEDGRGSARKRRAVAPVAGASQSAKQRSRKLSKPNCSGSLGFHGAEDGTDGMALDIAASSPQFEEEAGECMSVASTEKFKSPQHSELGNAVVSTPQQLYLNADSLSSSPSGPSSATGSSSARKASKPPKPSDPTPGSKGKGSTAKQAKSRPKAPANIPEPVQSAPKQGQEEEDDEWKKEGSCYLGRGILRTIINDDGTPGQGWGKITGWLPSDISDFVTEANEPAALWRNSFDDEELGSEDLEEHEVLDGIRAFELAILVNSRRGSAKKKGSKGGGKGRPAVPENTQELERADIYMVKEEVTSVSEIALELQVEAQELVRLNADRLVGINCTCKLKAGTIVFYPKATSLPPSVPEPLKELLPSVGASPQGATSGPSPLKEDTGPSPKLSKQKKQKLEPKSKPDGKTAVSKNRADTQATGMDDIDSGNSAQSTQNRAEVKPNSDWHLLLMPKLEFPAYPSVSESDGELIARAHAEHFSCPFTIQNGIVFATAGYEAVAPVTHKVDDSWAACDKCEKWRRLPATFLVTENAEFCCEDADKTCEDAEDPWDEDEEMEVANDSTKAIAARLPLTVGDLTVHSLGQILADKPGYWNHKHIFPVGFRSTRKYWNLQDTTLKSDYECVIQEGEEGPVFRVSPLDADGKVMEEYVSTAQSASLAWIAIAKRIEAARNGGVDMSADIEVDQSMEVDQQDNSPEPKHGEKREDYASIEMEESQQLGARRSPVTSPCGSEKSPSEPSTVLIHDSNHTHSANVSPEVQIVEIEYVTQSHTEDEIRQQKDKTKPQRHQLNGNSLFGLTQEKVQDLIKELPESHEVVRLQEDQRRRRERLAKGPKSLEDRLSDVPAHMWNQKNARLTIRNMSTGQIFIGDSAPKVRDIRRYLRDHPEIEVVDPAMLSKADMAQMQNSTQMHVCWDCKKGMFAAKKNKKFTCRVKLGHTGPDWKSDPRCKQEENEPLAHIRLPASFKYTWKEGQIMHMDYNKEGAPTLIKLPKDFIQDALQVNISWNDDVSEEGHISKVIEFTKREPEDRSKKAPRKVYVRPPWPPVVPENPAGCARGEPYVPKRHSDKAEFTYFAKEKFEPLLTSPEYKSMSELEKFNWMKQNVKRRLIVGRSGIQGHGIFAKYPIQAGEMVVEYIGEAIRPVVADVREERYESQGIGTYFWRLEDYLGAGEPPEGRAAIVDATKKHNIGHYMNHSCDPNCQAKIMTIKGQRKIVISAIHEIQFGEELTYDYKLPFEEDKIPCLCGSANCRGSMN